MPARTAASAVAGSPVPGMLSAAVCFRGGPWEVNLTLTCICHFSAHSGPSSLCAEGRLTRDPGDLHTVQRPEARTQPVQVRGHQFNRLAGGPAAPRWPPYGSDQGRADLARRVRIWSGGRGSGQEVSGSGQEVTGSGQEVTGSGQEGAVCIWSPVS